MPSVEDAIKEMKGEQVMITPGEGVKETIDNAKKAKRAKDLVIVIWAGIALGLIGWGLYSIYKPLCPITIGLMMWWFVVRSSEEEERFKKLLEQIAQKEQK